MNFIERTVDLINELQDISEKKDFYISVDRDGRKEVHITDKELFFENFNQFDIEKRSSSEFPYQAATEVDGVIFLTIMSDNQYKLYVQKNA